RHRSRDQAAHYHRHLQLSGRQSPAADRLSAFVRGVADSQKPVAARVSLRRRSAPGAGVVFSDRARKTAVPKAPPRTGSLIGAGSKMIWAFLGIAAVGAGVGVAVFAGEQTIARGVDFVEGDLRDKLRRLRISTRHLHRWVVAWIIAVLAALLGLTVLAGS